MVMQLRHQARLILGSGRFLRTLSLRLHGGRGFPRTAQGKKRRVPFCSRGKRRSSLEDFYIRCFCFQNAPDFSCHFLSPLSSPEAFLLQDLQGHCPWVGAARFQGSAPLEVSRFLGLRREAMEADAISAYGLVATHAKIIPAISSAELASPATSYNASAPSPEGSLEP